MKTCSFCDKPMYEGASTILKDSSIYFVVLQVFKYSQCGYYEKHPDDLHDYPHFIIEGSQSSIARLTRNSCDLIVE